MKNFMRLFLLGFAIGFCISLFTGCEWTKDQVKWAAEQVVGEPSEEELQVAREERLKKLKIADDQVEHWIGKIHEEQNSNGGYNHHEGFTEQDPWGNTIDVQYRQNDWDEMVTVRSAGPDGRLNTSDDLSRKRSVRNIMGVMSGNGYAKWLIIWLLGGILAFVLHLFVRMVRSHRSRFETHGPPILVVSLSCILVGPFICLYYIVTLLGLAFVTAIGSDFDGFDHGIDVGFLDFD